MTENTTICALATSPGVSPIAIIRLSGEKAIEIADRIFQSRSKKKLVDQKANTIHVGTINDGSELLDEVVVSIYRCPSSFTGENIVEISCHGSVYIQKQILQLLLKNGAQIAKPGEFTQRAFLNGKMDLSQAEAVADLISSTTRSSQKVALRQMRGGFSTELATLREQLIKFSSLIELELDFSEEDVEFADRKELRQLIDQIEEKVLSLRDSFHLGNVIKDGIPVAIIGETNVGKSTLLNALLNDEKAIVSDIPGTTRDVIEDTVNLQGTTFRFFDTAGLRETIDAIEKMGIQRTYSALKKAIIVLLVVDTTNPLSQILERINKVRELISSDQHLIIIANKTDIGQPKTLRILEDVPLADHEQLILLSAKKRDNLNNLVAAMKDMIDTEGHEDETIITNVRHYDALNRAAEAIECIKSSMEQQISGEFLTRDIHDCMNALGEITGQITNNEILGHIFKNFCIGK